VTKLLWSIQIFLVLLSGCGWNDTPTRKNDFVPLTSIEITSAVTTIAAKTSIMLIVQGNFSGQFTRDVTDLAVWTSDSPTVATFQTAAHPNRVTGRIPGTATLMASVKGISSTVKISVSSATVSTLTISPVDPSIPKGLTANFHANGTFSDGTTQDVTFDATWNSSAPDIASVSDAADDSKGYAKALAIGSSTITATFDGKSVTSLISVTKAVITSISLSPANPSLLSVSTGSFKATGNYSDATSADISALATWSSSSSGVATISGGAAKTLTQGSTTISAALDGVSASTALKVTGGNLTGIAISPVPATVVKDVIGRLTATGTFSNGATQSTRDISGVVEWTSADPAVATISKPGGNLVWLHPRAVSQTSKITATFAALMAETTIAVFAPTLLAITISPVSMELASGASGRMTVTATFDSGAVLDVTNTCEWTSDNETVATVGNSDLSKGRVKGVTDGTANIKAVYGGMTTVPAVVVSKARTFKELIISGAASVSVGNQSIYTVTARYTDGTINGTIDSTEGATFSIDNTNIALFADAQNQPGLVVAVDTGTVTLTVSFGGLTKTLMLTVP
jgi:hypothetical protein